MTRAFDKAAQAFVDHVAQEHWAQDDNVTTNEAWTEAHQLDAIAHKAELAIETMLMEIGSLEYVGKPSVNAKELMGVVLDYLIHHDGDEIGHKASDVLRASVEEG